MTKLVILNLGEGSVENGFPNITMQLGETGNLWMQVTGSLPPAPELPKLYHSWQILYKALNYYTNKSRSIEIEEAGITNFSDYEYSNICQKLDKCLNDWLGDSGFMNIEQQIRTQVNTTDSVRIIIQSDNHAVWQLPWHRWRLVKEDYPQGELVFSVTEYPPPPVRLSNKRGKTKILVILGNSQGIRVQEDEKFLKKLPNVELLFLNQPQRQELNERLWEKGWDILFFAGHSQSENEGDTGRIYINQNAENNSLTMGELEEALKQAIAKGLQLAIFNSCDGLGLMRQLASLGVPLPVAIVMREPVADQVAQYFLKYFLSAFASGEDFQVAVRQAREQLRGLEDEFPSASWLPVICQHPAVKPPGWYQPNKSDVLTGKKLASSLTFSFLVTILIVGMRMLGILQLLELNAFDLLLRIRPHEIKDERILMVIATPEDIQEQEFELKGKVSLSKRKASLSDKTLSLLLEKIEQQYQPTTIGLDIYRDFPVTPDNSELANYLGQNNLFGVCKVRSPDDGDTEGIPPPPDISASQIGFADFVADADNIVRRQLLAMRRSDDVTDPCIAVNSFSLLVALHYLQQAQGIEFDYTPTGELKIGDIVLEELDSYFGSYRSADTRGRQILLNYRSLDSLREIATIVTVGDIIEERIDSSRLSEFKGRIVLIGIADSPADSGDYWLTPLSINQPKGEKKIPGVFIQAHMVSQLISAVLDGRSLLWFLPLWGNFLWIWGWCLLASLLYRSDLLRVEVSILLILVFNLGVGYFFFLRGGLMPVIPSIIAIALVSFVEKTSSQKDLVSRQS